LIESGTRVIYVAFSAAEDSVPNHLPKDTLRKELFDATAILGIEKNDCLCLNYPVRQFPKYRQEILEKMIELSRSYKPDIVFLPSRFDTHQDHKIISEEGFRSFKKTTMLGYEVPWNNLEFKNNCFYKLTENNLATKTKALSCYQSQSHRDYASPDYIRALAITRGVQIGTKFAECFEVIRQVS
jgi:LmbE family N-acetylglucosaminyl deacetylase